MYDEWLDAHQASQWINISKSTIYGMAQKGTIPHVRVPGSPLLRFNRTDIDQWLRQKGSNMESD
jgi:excisionase family DNA binding protein